MRPLPPTNVTGHTDAERMDNAVRKMFSVSKDAILKAEAKERAARDRNQKRPKHG